MVLVKMNQKKKKSPDKDKNQSKNIKNIYGSSNVYYEARNNDRKIWAKKDILNKEARGLLSSYHFKTHFKATEEIAEYKANENKTNIKESCFLLPHLLPKNYRYRISNTENNSNTINNSISKSVKHKKAFDYSKLEDTRKIFNFDEEHEKDEIIEKNDESNYNIVNNPILMGNKLDIDPHSLKILSKLAFKPKLNEDDENSIDNNDINLLNSVKEKDYDKNKKKDTTNLNQVAKKILNECNVYTQKSKFNNSSHKSKGGKTMIYALFFGIPTIITAAKNGLAYNRIKEHGYDIKPSSESSTLNRVCYFIADYWHLAVPFYNVIK